MYTSTDATNFGIHAIFHKNMLLYKKSHTIQFYFPLIGSSPLIPMQMFRPIVHSKGEIFCLALRLGLWSSQRVSLPPILAGA